MLPGILAVLLIFSGCSGTPPEQGRLKGVSLPTLSGSTVELASCPSSKCLTVYLAPWCGYCRRATPLIIKLRESLKAKGVPTRVAVGMDGLQSLQEYARVFGPDTLLDPENKVGISAVPQFFLSDSEGNLVRQLAGAPESVEEAQAWVLQ